MRPAWAALGIILLMVSIFVVVGASLGYQKTEVNWDKDPTPVEALNSFNITRFLNQSDFFKLEIYPSLDWSHYVEPPGVYAVPFKASFVNITDPSGAQTEFECDFLMLSSDANKALVFYNVTGTGPNETIQAHGIGDVRFEIPYGSTRPGIVAQALSSGNYTGTVTWIEGGGSPCNSMKLTQGFIVTSKADYNNLYPVGLGVFAVSAVLLVYGFRKPKNTVPKRKVNSR